MNEVAAAGSAGKRVWMAMVVQVRGVIGPVSASVAVVKSSYLLHLILRKTEP